MKTKWPQPLVFGMYPKGFPAWIALDSKHKRAGEDVLMEDVFLDGEIWCRRIKHLVRAKSGGDVFEVDYRHLLFDIGERANLCIWGERTRKQKEQGAPWSNEKERIKRAYKYRCQGCDEPRFKCGPLQLHHTTYALSCFGEMYCPNDILIPMCADCHLRLHYHSWDPEQAVAISILEAGIEWEFRREDDDGINGARRAKEVGI